MVVYLIEFSSGTNRPIIGILSQETGASINKIFPGHQSYIAASYVKAVEASGARVVPVFINRTRQYYRDIVEGVNGLLFPGGSTWFYNSWGYADAGQYLLEEAKAVNRNGSHFPVLGICLGMELLLFLENGRQEYRADCSVKNVSLPLHLTPSAYSFSNASSPLIQILSTQNATYNQHQFCVTEKNLSWTGLSEKWKVLSTNVDEKLGLEFISWLVSEEFPFAGVQFHPEKNAYEWRGDLRINHSPDAIRASRLFTDWLVSQASNNSHYFKSGEEEKAALIYNYAPVYTRERLIYQQIYLFDSPR